MADNYYDDRNLACNLRLQALIEELPEFCRDFFIYIESRTTAMTRLNYGFDLRLFFRFLLEKYKYFQKYKLISEITLEDMATVNEQHVIAYVYTLNNYKFDGMVSYQKNGDQGKSRKLSVIKSFIKYLYKTNKIPNDFTAKIDAPKIRDKAIIRLDQDEVVDLLTTVEDMPCSTKKQNDFYQITRVRDIAIITLFLGTGIRISELVGLNIESINFDKNEFLVVRKGGKESILYFNDEVHDALYAYMLERMRMTPCPGHEHALFLSIQNKRIGVRAVEKMVKKYAQQVTPLKHITPHKLRSTFGTQLYGATGDIYVVAEVLGHSDVNTTRKHYAAMSEHIKRSAAQKVVLTKKNDDDDE